MRHLTPLCLALGFIAVSPAMAESADVAEAPAALHFVSDSPYLVGTSFGIDAVDALKQPIGARVDVEIAPGMRTVWYSCPDAPTLEGGLRLSYEFEAGREYELVCQAGQEATIRPKDAC